MTHSIVGKWGKNLAIRVPMDVARASGLADGETVEIELRDGDLVIRRRAAHIPAHQDAAAAATQIIADSRGHSLGDVSIRELLDEGRDWDASRSVSMRTPTGRHGARPETSRGMRA